MRRPGPELVAPPAEGSGRVYAARRRVRLGDARPSGRLRLDALARYLQDVAADDVTDAGLPDESRWVVRTTAVEIRAWPAYDQMIELVTWCSGTGPAWAERRTTVLVGARRAVEVASTWVNLDRATLRPAPLSEHFEATYLPATGGRSVRSRLVHPAPDDAALRRRWALRAADYDLLGHVNNAVAWVAVEDELARRGLDGGVVSGQVEYRSPIEAAPDVDVRAAGDQDELRLWLLDSQGRPAVSAVVQLRPPSGGLSR